FFHSMQVSSVAVGMISLYAYPVMTVFLEPWIKRIRLDWRDVISGVLVLVGIYLLVPGLDLTNTTTQGVLWGVLSALVFALRNLVRGHGFSRRAATRPMRSQAPFAALPRPPVTVCSPHWPTAGDWWLLIGPGIVFTAYTRT